MPFVQNKVIIINQETTTLKLVNTPNKELKRLMRKEVKKKTTGIFNRDKHPGSLIVIALLKTAVSSFEVHAVTIH